MGRKTSIKEVGPVKRIRNTMNNNNQFIGVVRDREFSPLVPHSFSGSSVRLTSIAMQEAQSPEVHGLDLTEYEGSALMVSGHYGGSWIYSAKIVDRAGPILTAVVQRVFSQMSRSA